MVSTVRKSNQEEDLGLIAIKIEPLTFQSVSIRLWEMQAWEEKWGDMGKSWVEGSAVRPGLFCIPHRNGKANLNECWLCLSAIFMETDSFNPFSKQRDGYYFSFFGSSGVWTWGLTLAREVLFHLSHVPSPGWVLLLFQFSRWRNWVSEHLSAWLSPQGA
jgi:hypothetical protein